MRQKFDNGEDPLDPESQQGGGGGHPFHGHPFGGGGPFQFKFHFNWSPFYSILDWEPVPAHHYKQTNIFHIYYKSNYNQIIFRWNFTEHDILAQLSINCRIGRFDTCEKIIFTSQLHVF